MTLLGAGIAFYAFYLLLKFIDSSIKNSDYESISYKDILARRKELKNGKF